MMPSWKTFIRFYLAGILRGSVAENPGLGFSSKKRKTCAKHSTQPPEESECECGMRELKIMSFYLLGMGKAAPI
jgi:hypothetical protein